MVLSVFVVFLDGFLDLLLLNLHFTGRAGSGGFGLGVSLNLSGGNKASERNGNKSGNDG
jgi:hypothetical protein